MWNPHPNQDELAVYFRDAVYCLDASASFCEFPSFFCKALLSVLHALRLYIALVRLSLSSCASESSSIAFKFWEPSEVDAYHEKRRHQHLTWYAFPLF